METRYSLYNKIFPYFLLYEALWQFSFMELIGRKVKFLYNVHVVAMLAAIGSAVFLFFIVWGMNKMGSLEKWKKEEFKTKSELLKGWIVPIVVVLFTLYALFRIYSRL